MSSGRVIDVTQIVEGQGRNRFVLQLLALATLITLFDGYDLNTISFAAPHIMREFHIPRGDFGSVFGIGLFGFLLGGLIFGWIADQVGRKPAIVGAAIFFGFLTFATAFATTVTAFTWLRFAAGLGLGGLVPVAWALVIEFVPKNFRATAVVVIMLGYSVGSSLGGFIAAGLIPLYTWRVVFWVGGLMPLAIGVLLHFTLPESIRFLAVKQRKPQEIAATIRRMRPDISVPADATFIVRDEAHVEGRAPFRLGMLFRGRLAAITPLLWIAYIGSSMVVFFLASWMPTLAEAAGLPSGTAAVGSALISLGGGLGGLVLMRFIDRSGAGVITIMPLLALPLVGAIGYITFGSSTFMLYMFITGFAVVGGHSGLHSIAGLFYPSAYRANGAGWAISIAKLGSIAGPWLGGIFLAAHWPLRDIFLFAAVGPLMFLLCIVPLGLQHRRLIEDDVLTAVPVEA
jgi:MFS transporter, AAHS family, 4-hydroxybenzoate transporter